MISPLAADQIFARADEAQRAGSASVSRRCSFLGGMRREIALNCESIAATIARKLLNRRWTRFLATCSSRWSTSAYYEANASTRFCVHAASANPGFSSVGAHFETHFEPHGVALIFGPSNYPLQLSMIPLITALIAGNAVVIKCSETHARNGRSHPIDLRKGKPAAPPGASAARQVPGNPQPSSKLGQTLFSSLAAADHGQQVAEHAAKHLIPTILELGGKDASLVFADCHLERAIEGIAYGAFSNAGRVCVAVKRVYVEASIYDKFLAAPDAAHR